MVRGGAAGEGGDAAAGAPGGRAGNGATEDGGEPSAPGDAGGPGVGGREAAGGGEAAGGSPAAGGAGGAGPDEPSFVIGAYVSPSGNDQTGDGTIDAPFETLTRAALVVQSGQAIGLMDGNHIVDYFAQIPDGVALVGVNRGSATLGQMPNFNGGITFMGDGAVDGLRLGYAVNLINVSTGTVRVTHTQFGAHGDGSGNDAAFIVGAAGELVLEAPSPEAAWYFEPNGGRVAQLRDGAKLSVNGGVFEGGIGGSVFLAFSGAADMLLQGVTFLDCSGKDVIALANGGINANASTLSLDAVTIDNSGTGYGINVGWGTPVVTIKNSTIDTQNGIGIGIDGDNRAEAQTQTLTIEDSIVTGNQVGIRSYYYGQALITLTNTEVDANTTGISFLFTDAEEGSTLNMTGGSISDNTGVGFDTINEANKPIKAKLRGVTVSGNGGHGLLLYGNAGAIYDLGTAADPGNNVLQNPGAGNANAAVVVNAPVPAGNAPTAVNAIGNTWLANQQGASAAGRYVPNTGNYTEVTGAVATGQNYRIVGAGQKLRL